MGRSDVGRLGLSRLPSFLQSGFTYSIAFQPLRSRQHLLWRYVGSPTARGAPQVPLPPRNTRGSGLAVGQAQGLSMAYRTEPRGRVKSTDAPPVTARSSLLSCSGLCVEGGPRGPVPMGAVTSTTPRVSTSRTGRRICPQALVTVGRQTAPSVRRYPGSALQRRQQYSCRR